MTDRSLFRLTLDGSSLTLDDLYAFLAAEAWRIDLAPEAVDDVRAANDQVKRWLHEGKPIYGLTRGLGPLKDRCLSPEEEVDFQRRVLESHATGIGEPFRDEIVRLAMLLRANAASQGRFGVRPELIERNLAVLNAGVVPLIPWEGSLGSGDLQPMAALGLVLTGNPHGIAKYGDDEGPAPLILAMAGLEPTFELDVEEALSIISGSTMLAAGTVWSLDRLARLGRICDAAFALSMEALRGETGALDPRIHDARGIRGQIEVARLARAMLAGSGWTTDEGRARLGEDHPRVQDAVSLRSTPHIHGSFREVHRFTSEAMAREINASTMNPLIFRNDEHPEGFEVLMGGNYDGSHMAHLLDMLNVVLTDVAGLCETRSARMISPRASYGLPPNLVGGNAGLNSGMVQVQSLQLSIIGQMRQQAAPASVHSLSGKDMQEDHNSMGNSSLYDLQVNIELAEQVVAIELMLAAQAIDLIRETMHPYELGAGTRELHAAIRRRIDPVEDDRFLRDDLEAMLELVRGRELSDLVAWFAPEEPERDEAITTGTRATAES